MFDRIEDIQRNSFRNFHAKGLDYLCLQRSPDLTRKVYFFEGNLSALPEIVMPHDHRYNFQTVVLSGCVSNRLFMPTEATDPAGKAYERFDYITPLNGGDGFTWLKTDHLIQFSEKTYHRDRSYGSAASDIHTLQIRSDQTVIMLDQYADLAPIGVPTRAWRLGGKEPPNLSGLYEEMTFDDVIGRLEVVAQLLAGTVSREHGF